LLFASLISALGSVKGVNIPNTTLQLPSMTEKDKEVRSDEERSDS